MFSIWNKYFKPKFDNINWKEKETLNKNYITVIYNSQVILIDNEIIKIPWKVKKIILISSNIDNAPNMEGVSYLNR